MIVPKYYEDLQVLHENTMPNRCYYIPASGIMSNSVENREASDRFQLLNGEWSFHYYDSIYDLQERFYETNYDVSLFDRVEVPGVWQNYGYDRHQYTNIRYPFPFDPPYVPQDNPCGAYVHPFFYHKCPEAPRAYLNFEGVDSCFYVWVNGRYVGYSQVSHCTSEFDVTNFLKEGENLLAVLVLKWCDGSYMEDQDKFRTSGIFRDVYILKRPEKGIFDYFVQTQQSEKKAVVHVELTYFKEFTPTRVSLFDREGNCIGKETLIQENSGQAKLSMEVEAPVLWSAELPYLYTLLLETENEIITERVGIREIHVADRTVYFNGKPIVFQGVNRHDFDPETGAAICIKQVIKDMTMMKQHNFNAIRSSHYPNSPWFYQLCDQYGFYVVDEADNESHGPSEIYYADDDFENKSRRWNEAISDNPAYIDATLDRVKRCVEREKNRPCIVIWSMGNECAYGCTFEAALKWTKEFDSTRLTHFESARYHSRKRKYDFSNLDLFSRMYPPFEEIDEYLDSEPDKPFILIEYCHSMGNGPGDLEDYFKIFHEEKLMCGGFVWEWCDHAVSHGKGNDGRKRYYYGGDHGETIHDGNFCMDGLVYPDRRPHTGLLEYKNVYRPVRARLEEESQKLVLRSYLDFTNTEELLYAKYEVICDGAVTESGEINPLIVKPGEEAAMYIPFSIPEKGRAFLKVSYYTKREAPLVPEGHCLGFDEIPLENRDGRNQKAVKLWESTAGQGEELRIAENDFEIVFAGSHFRYCFDKRNGLFRTMEYGGSPLIKKPLEINIWRAPTDNDMYVKKEWYRAGYDRTSARAYEAELTRYEDRAEVCCRMSLAADAIQKILTMHTVWTVFPNGAVQVSMEVKREPEFPMLPRFGLRLFLDKQLDQVTYYGMGPEESYCDKHRASGHGVYFAGVAELHEDYIRPQENGSHWDCSYVILEGGGQRLSVCAEKEFSFNASIYSQEELTSKKHNFELVPNGNTVLCLDYAQSGVGSNSCGPELSKAYRLEEKEFIFRMKWIPSEIDERGK